MEVERALDKVLPKLSAIERQVWETTEAMNDTGITVDADLLERVSALVADAATHLDANIRTATGGAVPRITDHAALTRWLVAQGVEQAAETGIGKQMVLDMLESVELDPLVRQVLMYRRDGGGSSAKKYRAIAKRLSADDRLRGALVYAGAAATGRWSSRGAQLQNLPRGGTVKTDDAIRDLFSGADINYIEDVYGPPLIVASELLRPVFTASPDHWLARGDYSQIEARVLAWLAGQENVLDAFLAYDRGTGPDLYKITASGIYGKPVEEITKAERQIGKVAMLALGYQGGKGAFLAMAKGYGVKVSEEKAEEIKLAWRAANPCIAGSGFDGSQVGLWKQLEWAALACVKDPPNIFHPVGDFGIGFRRNKKAMAMRLPSGRWLVYWWPKLEEVEVTWSDKKKLAVTYWAEDPIKKTWAKFTAYGGLWTENLVQAAARDLMAYALVRFTLVGIRPILTVHDEGIGEAPKTRFPRAEDAAAAVKQVMEHIPAWAAGLPVSADASAAERYVKA